MVVCLSRVDLHDRPANRGSYSRRYALAPGALPFPCRSPRQASRAGDRLDVVAENRLAVSRSPAITVLMPSRSGALLAIRFRTSSLKLRVSAISWLHSLSSCRRFPPIACSPPTVLSVAQCRAAGAAWCRCQHDYQRFAVASEINPIPRRPINSVIEHPSLTPLVSERLPYPAAARQ